MTQTLQTDSKGRINLGSRFADSIFLVEEVANGEFLLKKAAVVPESELWLHQNPEAKKTVLRGLAEAKERKLTKNAVDL